MTGFCVNLKKFKILGLFSVIHVAMATIHISLLTQQMSYKYYLSVPNMYELDTCNESYIAPPINVNHPPPLKLCSATLNDVTCTKQ